LRPKKLTKHIYYRMATLEKIRNKAGLLVGIVGLALFAFIIGDLLNSGSSILNSGQNRVVTVNGNSVDYMEYMARENELTEVYKLQSGQQNLSEAYMNQIRQGVYDEIVMENVLDPRLEELGISVTAEEMLDMTEGENISPVIRQLPFFQNQETGQFDRNAVINFLNQIKNVESYPESAQAQLQQYRMLWFYWEKNIKRNRLNEKYNTLLTKAVVANSLDAIDAFTNTTESSDIAYVMQSFSTVPDSTITVSEAELKQLYEQRKELLRQQETAIIDFVAVDIEPSKDDFDKASKEMDEIRAELETTDNVAALTNEKSEHKYVNAYSSENGFATDKDAVDFVTAANVGEVQGPTFKDNAYRLLKLVDKTTAPDSVNVSEILLAARATEKETREYADSLLATLNAGGDFVEAVKKHSVDQLVEKDGELGWVTEAGALQGINEEFRKTAFELPAGKAAVIKSNYGIHIIKVTERTKDVPKYKVADIYYTVTPSSVTRSHIYNALSQFVVKNNSIEKLEENAKENGYEIIKNQRVVKTDYTIANITGARSIVRWAFNAKKNQIADEIFECDGKFVVVANKGKLPEGYQSLATATPSLKADIIARKKGEQIADALKAKNLTTLDAYAAETQTNIDSVKFITMATTRITNIGNEPKLNAYITAAQPNTLSEPVAGSNGVYVFTVTNRTKDNTPYDPKTEKSNLEAGNNYRIGSFALRHIQQEAKIEDNRIRFY